MLLWCLLLVGFLPQEQPKPLPEVKSFLAEFRKTLHSDRTRLRQYTFTEKETEITLDSHGQPRKTEEHVYHVIPGAEEWQTYRKLISKDGKPLSEQELAKEDRDQQDDVEKENRKHTQKERDKEDREEQATLDDVFSMYDVQLVRRKLSTASPPFSLHSKANQTSSRRRMTASCCSTLQAASGSAKMTTNW